MVSQTWRQWFESSSLFRKWSQDILRQDRKTENVIAVGPAGETECHSERWALRRLVWLSGYPLTGSPYLGRRPLLKVLACSEPRLSLFLSQRTTAHPPPARPALVRDAGSVGLCGKCPRRPLGWAEGMWHWHHLKDHVKGEPPPAGAPVLTGFLPLWKLSLRS